MYKTLLSIPVTFKHSTNQLTCTQTATVTKGHSTDRSLLIRRSAKLRIRAAQECSKVAFECPEVVLELVQDIFDFFDYFFQGKEIIKKKYYFWKK